MPRHNRILVRYRLPESGTQWSELQWCDIEKNAEGGSIEVRVAPAEDAVMPEDTAFRVLPPEEAKKLLVWDVSDQNNHAPYCLVIQANALYRFNFDSRTKLLMHGQYWSFEENDYDNKQSALQIQKTFNKEIDQRLAMRTQEIYNYTQLTDKAEKLPALELQYRAWQQKVIQDGEREAADQEHQKHLDAERLREAAERNLAQQEADAERVAQRPPDRVRRDTLLPTDDDLDEDAAIAELLQQDEIANANANANPFFLGMPPYPINPPHGLQYEEEHLFQPAGNNLDRFETEFSTLRDEDYAKELQDAEFRRVQTYGPDDLEYEWEPDFQIVPVPVVSNSRLNASNLAQKLQKEEFSQALNIPMHPQAHDRSRSPAFFAAQHGPANPPPRPPRPELKHVILALMGAAFIGYGLHILAYTSPWIGIGVIGLGALCVCAAVLGRRPPQVAAERLQLPDIFGYLGMR